jgi:hypothetical protein
MELGRHATVGKLENIEAELKVEYVMLPHTPKNWNSGGWKATVLEQF